MITIEAALEEYELAMKAEGLSDKYVSDSLIILEAWARDYAAGQTLDMVGSSDMRRYMIDQLDEKSRTTARDYHYILSRFWAFAQNEWGVDDPMNNIKRPRKRPTPPKHLPPDDFMKVWDELGYEPIDKRDRFLFALIADTGMRRGEVERLTLDTLELTHCRARITRSKSRRLDWVYFTPVVAQLGHLWMSVRPETDSDRVFVDMRPGRGHSGLTGHGIREIFRRYKRATGIKDFYPHLLRHLFVQLYLEGGGDAATLCKLVGWSDVRMVSQYNNLPDDQLKQRQWKHSPIRKMMG